MEVQASLLSCWSTPKNTNNGHVDMCGGRGGEEEGAEGRVAGGVGRVDGRREGEHVEVGVDDAEGEEGWGMRGG